MNTNHKKFLKQIEANQFHFDCYLFEIFKHYDYNVLQLKHNMFIILTILIYINI